MAEPSPAKVRSDDPGQTTYSVTHGRSLRMFYATNPSAPKNRCPTWVFLTTATKAFEGSDEAEDSALALEDIVCIIASLIDQVGSNTSRSTTRLMKVNQSLILGHLSYSSQQLVMKPSLDGLGGFPKVSQVVPRRVDAIA